MALELFVSPSEKLEIYRTKNPRIILLLTTCTYLKMLPERRADTSTYTKFCPVLAPSQAQRECHRGKNTRFTHHVASAPNWPHRSQRGYKLRDSC